MFFIRKCAMFGAAAVAATALLQGAPALAMTPPEADTAVARIVESEPYRAMAKYLNQSHDRIVQETIALQQIPAPPFGEQQKAEAFAKLMTEAGLKTQIDEEGNVLALWQGTGGGDKVHAVIAHIDTVFNRETDLSTRRVGSKIYGPGILDDSRGLAAVAAYVRAMKQAKVTTRDNILFVGSVGEEGLGDLRGVKHLFLKGEYRNRIQSAIIVDGGDPARVVLEGPGSKRYEVNFKGPGGHSYRAFGLVNPAYALGHAMVEMGKLKVPKGTTYSVGLIGGGTSVNAIPNGAWMQVDMRSGSPQDLADLETRFLAIVEQAVRQENEARRTDTGSITVQAKLVGDRPPGKTAQDHRLAQVAMAAMRALEWTPGVDSSSTDANIPMSMGIPAIAVGAGIGGNGHSAENEYLDVEQGPSVRALLRPLLSILEAAQVELKN